MNIIEGDSTLPSKVKETTLRRFSQNLGDPGWKFDHAQENQVLVQFPSVVSELALLNAE
jgi:hypothetical protein